MNQKWIFRCKEARMCVKSAPFMPAVPRRNVLYSHTKNPFTPGEQMALAKYLYRNNKHERGAMSLKTYTTMLDKMPTFPHTAESCKEHYKNNRGRIDELVAVYRKQVQKRRDWGKDPYSDEEGPRAGAEAGRIDHHFGTKRRDAELPSPELDADPQAGASRQPSTKGKEREIDPPLRRPELAIGPAAAVAAVAHKTASSPEIAAGLEPSGNTSRHGYGKSPRAALEIEGPTSSKRKRTEVDEVVDHAMHPFAAAGASASTSSLNANTDGRPSLPETEVPFVTFDEDEQEEAQLPAASAVFERRERSSSRLLAPAHTIVRSVPRATGLLQTPSATPPPPSASTSAALPALSSLTSQPLPAALTAEPAWSGLHLGTLLSQRQLKDLVFALSGSTQAALDFASILSAKKFGSSHGLLSAEQKRRLKELRELIWTPEEDTMVLDEVGNGMVPKEILDKHGYQAYKERVIYLAEYAEQHGRDELSRSRFPFV